MSPLAYSARRAALAASRDRDEQHWRFGPLQAARVMQAKRHRVSPTRREETVRPSIEAHAACQSACVSTLKKRRCGGEQHVLAFRWLVRLL